MTARRGWKEERSLRRTVIPRGRKMRKRKRRKRKKTRRAMAMRARIWKDHP